MADRTVLYQGVGAVLTHFDVDVEAATLTRRTALTLPSNVQYVWPHPSRKFIYVSTSDAASGNTPVPGVMHRICALRVAPDGSLAMHGEPQALPSRPIHHCVNPAGTHVLSAFNNPSNITVHPINADGTLGPRVGEKARVDVGIYAHQVTVAPSNRIVVFPARGNDARDGKPEDPGAIKVFGFDGGQLTDAQNIVGGRNGYGYRPRHVDFHPARPWMYANIESQNEMHMHRLDAARDRVDETPAFTTTTLAGDRDPRLHQATSAIHVHPNGRFVYSANRADGTVAFDGKRVFAGGENSIAVFAIDPATGEPRRIQSVDPLTHHVRTFGIDPGGRLLITASIRDMWTRHGKEARLAPAGMTVFRIGRDGTLDLVRKYDVELSGKLQWWIGMMGL
ncbi:MAG: beta-propeller fold lactonase family protein [Burkholderiales bacterium]|nr:beta-propeller fold lactonase family protein [Burkholderiales bacterium]